MSPPSRGKRGEVPIDARTRFLELEGPFVLESGVVLPQVRVANRTRGSRSPAGDNAVLVCHALTGSADVDRWWGSLLGPGRALDPERDFIVCANVLGSCYGSSGPRSERSSGWLWGSAFPAVTVRDMVQAQERLLDALGVGELRLVVGGSLGGMQVLEWALCDPARAAAIAPIATCGRHSAWSIALSAAQRAAIEADPRWRGGLYPDDDPPRQGLAAARAIAMCSYRSRESFERRFGRRSEIGLAGSTFAVEGYLRHHGQALVERFDAASYVALTHAMDTHDIARGRGAYEEVLRSIAQPALVVTIDTDVLYPPEEQWELAQLMPNARLAGLASPHGHDAFLIEGEAMNGMLVAFREEVTSPPAPSPVRGGGVLLPRAVRESTRWRAGPPSPLGRGPG